MELRRDSDDLRTIDFYTTARIYIFGGVCYSVHCARQNCLRAKIKFVISYTYLFCIFFISLCYTSRRICNADFVFQAAHTGHVIMDQELNNIRGAHRLNILPFREKAIKNFDF